MIELIKLPSVKEGRLSMIKVIYGEKGMGKTKVLVDTANKLSAEGSGDIVFIDDSTQLIYDLKHEIRFVNTTDFPDMDPSGFFGFVCGILSQDYDIEGIFIDGLNYIVKKKADELGDFFEKLSILEKKTSIGFYITINGKNDDVPGFLAEFL